MVLNCFQKLPEWVAMILWMQSLQLLVVLPEWELYGRRCGLSIFIKYNNMHRAASLPAVPGRAITDAGLFLCCWQWLSWGCRLVCFQRGPANGWPFFLSVKNRHL